MVNKILKLRYLFKLIALLTPKLGEGLESIDELEKSELVWTTDLKKI